MKAIVIKFKGNNAALLLDDGQFIMMRNHDYTIGEEINIMKKPSYQKRFLVLAVSAAILVMIITAGIFTYATPAYYISLDVNPSFIFEVNLFERIIGMETMNDDAETIIADINWKNKNVDDVMTVALQKIAQEGKFNNGGSILMTAAGKSQARTAKLLAGLEEKTDVFHLQDVSVQTESVGIDMVTAAREFGLTPGKYNLITKLLGETVTNDNKEMYLARSVEELMADFSASKASMGRETARSAKQNNRSENRPAEAEAGRQKAEYMSSEASQKKSESIENANQEVSEATQQTTEVVKAITEPLPIKNNQPAAEIVAGTEDEITHQSVDTPTDSLADVPDVPDNPEIPDVPASTSEQVLPTTNNSRP